MGQIYLIGEDTLCCAMGERLISDVLGWTLALPAINKGGITKLVPSIPRYMSLASIYPVLCIADTDRGCALELLKRWLPAHKPPKFLFRLAVTEAESWLLADSDGFAKFLDIASKHVPPLPDTLVDPKRTILALAGKSRQRHIRKEVVSARDRNIPGSGYNQHLRNFIAHHWSPSVAAVTSPSLARAVRRLEELKEMD